MQSLAGHSVYPCHLTKYLASVPCRSSTIQKNLIKHAPASAPCFDMLVEHNAKGGRHRYWRSHGYDPNIVVSTFEPHVDPSTVLSETVVLLSTIGLAGYWWLVIVPSERRSLSKNKRKGPLSQYLADLRGDDSRRLERWFYTDWLTRLPGSSRGERQAGPSASEPGEAEPASPPLSDKEPSFWSLDNPIVFVGALLVLLVGVAAIGN